MQVTGEPTNQPADLCVTAFTTLAACIDITGLDGFEDVTRTLPTTFFAQPLQAALLTYFNTVAKVGCCSASGSWPCMCLPQQLPDGKSKSRCMAAHPTST